MRCILVETANRFARDLIVQETGWRFLQAKGIELIAVDSPEAFLADTPTAVLIRQILGAVSQFEKASLVAKLKVARVRKRQQTGKCEGRKGWTWPSASSCSTDVGCHWAIVPYKSCAYWPRRKARSFPGTS